MTFSHLLEAGVAGLVDAITSLEKELRNTQDLVETLREKVRHLENAQPTSEADIESMIDDKLEDKIEAALDMRLDDEIESRLAGREITVTL